MKIKLMKHKNRDLEETPFSVKADPNVIGRRGEKELLIDFIKNGDVCLLTGLTGTGKSSLLLWLAERSRSHNMFYIDAANIEKGFSLKKFLKSSRRGFDRFRDYPRNAVVLLDESQDCDKQLQKALKLHWDHNHVKSVVLTQIDQNLENFSISFRDRVGNRIIKLGKIDNSCAIGLIKSRLKNKASFDTKTMQKIIRKGNYIPRKILEICELIYLNNKKKKLKSSDVKKILEKIHVSNKKKKLMKKISKRLDQKFEQSLGEVQRYKIYETGDIDKKRLTLLQKKILFNIENGFKTAKEIAENLEVSLDKVEKELRKLYNNKIITND